MTITKEEYLRQLAKATANGVSFVDIIEHDVREALDEPAPKWRELKRPER